MSETEKSIKATANNLISKHGRMIIQHSAYHHYDDNGINTNELAIKHAIVSVNQILSVVSTNWGTMYWGGVLKQIKKKKP